MASDIVYQAVKNFVTSTWTECPVYWENENYDPAEQSVWMAVEISGTSYAQESIGAENQGDNRYDEDGILWIHVFVPSGTGSLDARRVAKAAADLFRGARLLGDDLEFMDASIGLGDQGDDEGTTFRISVSIDWRHFEA